MLLGFHLPNSLRTLPIIGLAVALIIIGIQFVFRLPPLSITASGPMREFTSPSGDFVLSYPIEWSLTVTPKGTQDDPTVVALIDNPKIPLPGASVVIRRSRTPLESLDEVARWADEVFARERNYRPVSTEKLTLNNEETILHEFSTELAPGPLVGNPVMRCLANYRLHNHFGYILAFCSSTDDFPQLGPVFQQMIRSFQYLR